MDTGRRPELTVRSWVVAAAVCLAVTACTSDPAPTPSPPTQTSAAPTPTPTTPSATPTTDLAATDRSDPALGISFEGIPGGTGPEAIAADVWMQFEVEAWRSLTTGKLSPDLDRYATDDVVAIVAAQVDGNEDRGYTVSGKWQDTFVSIEGDVAPVVTVCANLDDVVFTRNGKATSGPDAGYAPTTVRADVAQAGTGWRVTSYQAGATC